MDKVDFDLSKFVPIWSTNQQLYVISLEENEKWLQLRTKYGGKNELIPEHEELQCYVTIKDMDVYKIKQPLISIKLKFRDILFSPFTIENQHGLDDLIDIIDRKK